MRLKYRIWDNENGKYFEPTHKDYRGELSELLMQPNGSLVFRTLEGGLQQFDHESMFPDRFIVEWWTGLTDKTGKDIYEGDIVLSTWGLEQDGVREYSDEEVIDDIRYAPESLYYGGDAYIIGNIHTKEEPDGQAD